MVESRGKGNYAQLRLSLPFVLQIMRLELLLHALLLLVVLFLLVRALVALARRVVLLLPYYTYSKVRRSLVRCMYWHFEVLVGFVVVGFLLWMRDRDLEMAEWGIVVLP